MGRTRENPRYNVLSCRAGDAELKEILAAIGDRSRTEYILQAVLEKVRRDRQKEPGHALS